MGDDGTTATLPPPPAPSVPDQMPTTLPPTKREKVGSFISTLLKPPGQKEDTPLQQHLKEHYQRRYDEAKMYHDQVVQYGSVLTIGKNPQTGQPLTDEERKQYQNWYDAALQSYTKAAGVDKQSKQALQRNTAIAQHIIQSGDKQQGQSGLPAPPAATDSAQKVANQPSSLPPPPSPGLIQSEVASVQKANEAGMAATATGEAQRKLRAEEAKDAGLTPGTRDYQEFMATGKFPTTHALNPKPYADADGKSFMGVPDDSGQIVNVDTQEVVSGATPVPMSEFGTHTLNIIGPDGKPQTAFRVGKKVVDKDGNPIEGELIPFQRGMVLTESEREVMGMDANGNPTRYVLRTKRTPVIPGVKMPGSASESGGASPSRPSAKPSGGAPAAKGSSAVPVFPTGAWSVLNKQATAINEARNSLIGDNFPGEVGGLASDLRPIFNDPESVKRVSQYLGLVNAQVENEGKNLTGQGAWAATEWYLNLPQTVVNLQQGALRDASSSLNPQEQQFVADYYRVMGTIGGMRASTGASAAQWSYNTLRSELPTPGPVTNYNEAARRLKNFVQETNIVSKRNRMVTPVDTSTLDGALGVGKSGLPAPPKPSGGSPQSLQDKIKAAAAAHRGN
jgi:hypothetical protein